MIMVKQEGFRLRQKKLKVKKIHTLNAVEILAEIRVEEVVFQSKVDFMREK
jgi:hypothetical protein